MSALSREELLAAGYAERDCSFSMKTANVWGLLAGLLLAALIVALYYLCADFAFLSATVYPDFIVLAVLLIASVPLHELLHALGWGAATLSFKGIRFGIAGLLNPYCHCSRPMRRAQYLFGVLLPLLLLGVVFALVGILTGFFVFLAVALFNAIAAGADILVAFRASFTRCAFVLDHPERCGFLAYTKQDT